MDYKLSITRREKNPDYKEARTASQVFNQPYNVQEYSTYEVLDVEVSPEQFEAIRKAILENF